MNIIQIEENLHSLIKGYKKEEFIYDLLRAYGLPKASITRLKKGSYDLSDDEDDSVVSWKKRVYYKVEHEEDLHTTVMKLADQVKHDQRFIVVTDFETLLARDIKTKENLDIPIEDLAKHYDFFLPWAGMEKTDHQNENPADVKAAEKMAKLFDEIKKDNPDDDPDFIHEMNVFLSRLLFCFFAEDTNIFKDGQFTNGIASHTQEDGSDLDSYLNKLFTTLNTKKSNRAGLPAYLNEFPYVNGGLFKDDIQSPKFTRRSRQAIIDSGELDWSAINPDIFGSMMQAVITPEHRGGLGMHYTSVPNIMKVIKPLFLNDLNEVYEKGQNEPRKLIKLLERISQIKIFDPACGSGNFLIIAYKELRRLEMKIIRRLIELKKLAIGFKMKQDNPAIIPDSQLDLAESYEVELFSRIQLTQFYGIELDDFAHEIAQLSLWLAEHQMNVEFYAEFGRMNPTLPLKQAGKIIQGNSLQINWNNVCPIENSETYILGNPPYLGFNVQTDEQKDDIRSILHKTDNHKYLDYIVSWFVLASRYINEKSKFGFVTTNSICQGAQVAKVWPEILSEEKEIFFAYPEFLWSNNAKNKAGVTCSIIGVRHKSKDSKYLYDINTKKEVENINPYLTNAGNVIVQKRQKPLSKLTPIATGNVSYDGGHLKLSPEEKEKLLKDYPEANKFILPLSGSREFIRNEERYCIWINEDDLEEALAIAPIEERVEKVRETRENGGKISRNYAHLPYRFYMNNRAEKSQIIVPRVSSIRRRYIPTGFLGPETIISDSAQAIYDPKPYMFSIINSYMHMLWVGVVTGKLKSDFRYSAILCYNTFPFPPISDKRKQELNQCVFRILDEREKYTEKTLGELYDPDKMPESLLEAHIMNDEVIEKCYRSRPFDSDEQRLEYLFKLYEEMIEEEKAKA